MVFLSASLSLCSFVWFLGWVGVGAVVANSCCGEEGGVDESIAEKSNMEQPIGCHARHLANMADMEELGFQRYEKRR